MYLPSHFREERAEVLAEFIRAHSLGMLVTLDGARPEVDFAPMLLEDGPAWRLRGHVARGNSVWRRVADGEEVLVLFHGPDHYVTPSWYESKRTDGKVVPTWNYAVVEVRGRVHWFDDTARLHALVGALTHLHEAERTAPWSIDDAPADYLAGMLRAIIGFEIEVSTRQGKFKSSQNRSGADRAGVRTGLAADGVAAPDAALLLRDPPG
ncbi:MAG: FMN-binding negative transcriptional regulator [Proteobacteria bacterium]|nr:FMN-binding negative transcriptional regulator [Pseudomonadota bacterium]